MEVHSQSVRSLDISVMFQTNLQELQIKITFSALTADCMNTARVTMSWAGLWQISFQ